MPELVTNKITDSLESVLLETAGYINVTTGERILSIAVGACIFYRGIAQVIKHPLIALQETVLGGYLLYRGATGYCPVYAKLGKDTSALEAVRITERLVVNRPREEVYGFWRKLENFPRFMKHLASVEQINNKVSYWKANIPGDPIKVSWNSEITKEEANSYIEWQSVAGSQIDNVGKVEFKDALNGEGTELNIEINYSPPAGNLGQVIARLWNGLFEKMVREDIINFKRYIEGAEYQNYASTASINE